MAAVIIPGLRRKRALLDSLGQAPAMAVSLRRLTSRYNGTVVRVRRSTDSATLDVGFAGNYVDIGAIQTFIGANSGFVVRIYDQMVAGGTRYFEQTTAASQPRIINAGALDADSTTGRAGLQAVASSARMTLAGSTAYSPPTSGAGSVFGAFRAGSTNSNLMILGTAADNGTTNGLRQLQNGRFTAGTSFTPAVASVVGAKYLMEGRFPAFGTITPQLYRNGALQAGGTSGTLASPLGAGTVLFARAGVSADTALLFEAMWFDLDVAQATRDKIESSVGAFYGITMS